MSSPTVSLQNSGLAAQTAATGAVVSIPDVPPEMLELPTGSVLPAVFIPAETASEMPVLQMTLPDGKELAVPVKTSHILRVLTPVSVKILPFDAKKTMTVRVHFSAPLPDIKKAIKELPEALRSNETAAASPQKHSIPLRAFVLRSVPEQITALMNEIEAPAEQNLPTLKPDQTVRLEISPQPEQTADLPEKPVQKEQISPATEQNVSPKAQTSTDIHQPALQTPNAPLPETPDILPATNEQPATIVFPVKENPTAPFEQTPAASSPVQSAQTTTVPETASTPVPAQQETTINAFPLQSSADVQTASADVSKASPALSAIPDNTPAEKQNVSVPSKTEQAPSAPPAATEKPTENTLMRIPLKGVVFDFKERTAPLVVTKAGVLALEEKIQLPHLTPVNVQITEIAEPPAFAVTAHTDSPVFQGIEETLTLLQKTDPVSFEAFKDVLPQIGNKLPAQIISFINTASQSTPVPSFIGEANIAAIQNLGEKGHSLLTEIEKEIKASPKKVSDGRSSWKGWTIPFLSGAIVEPVSLYLQKPQEEGHRQNGAARKQNAIRFVLDLNLTRLGKMQMDGLAHRNERRFDLIVRHQNDLPVSFDDKIRFIFTQTLTALNYTGTVNVDHTDQFIVLTEQIDVKTKQGVWA